MLTNVKVPHVGTLTNISEHEQFHAQLLNMKKFYNFGPRQIFFKLCIRVDVGEDLLVWDCKWLILAK